MLEPNGLPTAEPTHVHHALPNTRPPWDPNTKQGKEALKRYRQLLLQDLRSAARRPTNLSKSLQALHLVRQETRQLVSAARAPARPPGQPHDYSPGDWIWVKKIQPASLEPRWDRPFPVILGTPTFVEAAGRHHWVHHTGTQAAHPPQASERWTLRQAGDSIQIRLLQVQSGPP